MLTVIADHIFAAAGVAVHRVVVTQRWCVGGLHDGARLALLAFKAALGAGSGLAGKSILVAAAVLMDVRIRKGPDFVFVSPNVNLGESLGCSRVVYVGKPPGFIECIRGNFLEGQGKFDGFDLRLRESGTAN